MKVCNLCKAFGEHVLFRDLSFTCDGGMILSAPSGWGKTTLFRIILGLEKADGGEITDTGSVGAVFQEDRLIPHMNAVENVSLVCPKSIGRKEIESALSALGLDGEVQLLPTAKLSGGQKRRVALARAMLYPCDTLLLDEPFTGMDGETKRATIAFIREKQQGRRILIACHDREAIRELDWPVLALNEMKKDHPF